MDNRAMSPVVEKTVAIGLVALFAGGLVTSLATGTVPAYEQQAGREMGDRVLASAVDEIERTVPASERAASVRREVELPATIEGEGFRLAVNNRTLSLDHPTAGIGGSARIAVPQSVTIERATWSGGSFVVRMTGTAGNRTLVITEGAA